MNPTERNNLIPVVQHRIRFHQNALSLTAPTKAKVPSKKLVSNNIKETSNTKIPAEKATEPIKVKPTVCTKEGENNSFQSAGNMEENKIALISKKENKNTQFVATKLTSLPLIETAKVAEIQTLLITSSHHFQRQ